MASPVSHLPLDVFGVDQRSLPFVHSQVLAGKDAPDKPVDESTVARIKRTVFGNGLLESAKGVKLPHHNTLPWQHDTKGLRYATSHEQLLFKLNWLRFHVGLPKRTDDLVKSNGHHIFYTSEPPATHLGSYSDILRPVLLHELVRLETEYALVEAEEQFQHDLRRWMSGDAPDKEYRPCFWCPNKSFTGKTAEEQQQILLNERRAMVKGHATRFNRGYIEDNDIYEQRKKVFLTYLQTSIPRTPEQAFLYYKYIVLQDPVADSYIYTPEWFQSNPIDPSSLPSVPNDAPSEARPTTSSSSAGTDPGPPPNPFPDVGSAPTTTTSASSGPIVKLPAAPESTTTTVTTATPTTTAPALLALPAPMDTTPTSAPVPALLAPAPTTTPAITSAPPLLALPAAPTTTTTTTSTALATVPSPPEASTAQIDQLRTQLVRLHEERAELTKLTRQQVMDEAKDLQIQISALTPEQRAKERDHIKELEEVVNAALGEINRREAIDKEVEETRKLLNNASAQRVQNPPPLLTQQPAQQVAAPLLMQFPSVPKEAPQRPTPQLQPPPPPRQQQQDQIQIVPKPTTTASVPGSMEATLTRAIQQTQNPPEAARTVPDVAPGQAKTTVSELAPGTAGPATGTLAVRTTATAPAKGTKKQPRYTLDPAIKAQFEKERQAMLQQIAALNKDLQNRNTQLQEVTQKWQGTEQSLVVARRDMETTTRNLQQDREKLRKALFDNEVKQNQLTLVNKDVGATIRRATDLENAMAKITTTNEELIRKSNSLQSRTDQANLKVAELQQQAQQNQMQLAQTSTDLQQKSVEAEALRRILGETEEKLQQVQQQLMVTQRTAAEQEQGKLQAQQIADALNAMRQTDQATNAELAQRMAQVEADRQKQIQLVQQTEASRQQAESQAAQLQAILQQQQQQAQQAQQQQPMSQEAQLEAALQQARQQQAQQPRQQQLMLEYLNAWAGEPTQPTQSQENTEMSEAVAEDDDSDYEEEPDKEQAEDVPFTEGEEFAPYTGSQENVEMFSDKSTVRNYRGQKGHGAAAYADMLQKLPEDRRTETELLLESMRHYSSAAANDSKTGVPIAGALKAAKQLERRAVWELLGRPTNIPEPKISNRTKRLYRIYLQNKLQELQNDLQGVVVTS